MNDTEFKKAHDRCWATACEYKFPPEVLNLLIDNLLKLRNDGDVVGNNIKMMLIRLMWNREEDKKVLEF